MKTYKQILLYSTVCLSLAACANASGPRYVPRADLSPSEYTDTARQEDRMDRKSYKRYERREPCQKYRAVPRGMVEDGCLIQKEQETKVTQMTRRPEQMPIVSTYTVYFGFDKTDIVESQQGTFDLLVSELKKYDPVLITVTGYTDTSGKADYNQDLSQRRANAVMQALKNRGIDSQALDSEARGETELAVQTGDGVRMPDNRRVLIDFRR